MPLRAIINGKEIVSSFLSKEEWKILKEEVKNNLYDVIIYQTKKKGYLRTSKKGVQHFVHKKGEKPDYWKPETPQHLKAKNEILLGCSDAGWNAIPEFIENEWIADVLAFQRNKRIAFEVQWSPQTFEKTVERQKRYKKDNVRGCWFFKKPPKEMMNWEDEVKADKDLPLFKIIEKENKIFVEFQKQKYELRFFVKTLLEGKINFSPLLTTKQKQEITISFYEKDCWKCGAKQHSYFIKGPLISKCGLEIYSESGMWKGEDIEFYPEIIEEVKMFLKTKEGQKIKLGQIKKRYSNTVESSYKSFGCYKCDAIFGDFYRSTEINEALIYKDELIEFSTEVFLRTIKQKKAHWCYNEKKDFCNK